MKLVIIESPFAPDRSKPFFQQRMQERRHMEYLAECMMDCWRRGEAPWSSLLYTEVLDDRDALQRRLGIETGLAWGSKADLTAVYTDLGISPGMREGIKRAELDGRPVEYREIGT